MTLVCIENISFSYGKIDALKDVSLSLEKGNLVGIIGANGSGKSTLIKCLCGLLDVHKGHVTLEGTKLSSIPKRKLATLVGYVPQIQERATPSTVFDTVLMGRIPHLTWSPTKKDLEIVAKAMETMEITEFSLRDIHELSGGQQQRVFIARAMAQEPKVLCLDEPTSSLDIKHQLGLMRGIRDITREKNILALMAVHDLNIASQYCDSLIILKEGYVYKEGKPNNVLCKENIKDAFGIDVAIHKHGDFMHIVPVEESIVEDITY